MDPDFELKDMAELFSDIETEELDPAKRLTAKSRKLAKKFFETIQPQQINEQDETRD